MERREISWNNLFFVQLDNCSRYLLPITCFSSCQGSDIFAQLMLVVKKDLYQPSIAYLKKRSFTLKTVALSESWLRRKVILFIKSSTTWFTSSENTATSRGRMTCCLSTLRILSQSSPSLENRKWGTSWGFGVPIKCLTYEGNWFKPV